MELFLRKFKREKFPIEHCYFRAEQNVQFCNKLEMHFDL